MADRYKTALAARLAKHTAKVGDLTSVGMRRVLLRFVERRCAGSQKIAAEWLGVSPQHLNDVLNLRRDISPAILRGLGYDRVCIYRHNGHPLPPAERSA